MMWKKQGSSKKIVSVVLSSILSLSLLAACGSSGGTSTPTNTPAPTNNATTGSNTSGNDTSPATPAEPITISIMAPYFDPEPPSSDSEIVAQLEKNTNTKLDITWVPSSAYDDKVNVTIASGELPQVLTVLSPKNANVMDYATSGGFWDLTDYIPQLPNISQFDENVFKNTEIYGKRYGIFRPRPIARAGYIIRKDWLDNLGLQTPTTIDELYETMKAFTLNDPDGNGRNDTLGFVADRTFNVGFMTVQMGGPNNWGLQDGQLLPNFMFPEYKQAMDFYKKLYEEGLMNRDFAIVASATDLVNQGKAGITLQAMDNAKSKFTDLTKVVATGELDVFSQIAGPKGVFTEAGAGYYGTLMFSTKSIKTEEELKQILTFFDQLNEPENFNLIQHGIEGKHYSVEDGKAVIIDAALHAREVVPFGQIGSRLLVTKGLQRKLTPFAAKVDGTIEEGAKVAVFNMIEPFISATNQERGAELTKIINDATIKYILGDLNDAGWDQAIADWKSRGGDQVIAEFNEEYAKANN